MTCSPTSNRFYLTKKQNATDNVVVTASANTPVTFIALANGEANGGTVKAPRNNFRHFIFLQFCTDPQPREVRCKSARQLASTSLPYPSEFPRLPCKSTVTLQYKVTDGNSNAVRCRPKKDSATVAPNVAWSGSVLVYVDGAPAPVTFTATNPAGGTVSYILGHTQATGGSAAVPLTAGPSIPVSQWNAPVSLTLNYSGRVKIYYSAQDQNNNFYDCIPPSSKLSVIANTAIQKSVTVDAGGIGSGNTVTFTAIAVDEDQKFYVSTSSFGS